MDIDKEFAETVWRTYDNYYRGGDDPETALVKTAKEFSMTRREAVAHIKYWQSVEDARNEWEADQQDDY